MNRTLKRVLLSLGSFGSTVAPLAAVLALNWDKYTQTVEAGEIRLAAGGMLIAVLAVLKTLGKMKVPKRVWFYGICACGSWLLQAVLPDLTLIFTAALAGECGDIIFFRSALEKMQKKNETEDTAQMIAKAIESANTSKESGRI